MVNEIKNEPPLKKLQNFIKGNPAIVASLLLVPVIAVTFVMVHQRQDLQQRASGPTDYLVYPEETGTGVLRVITNAGSSTTITVLNYPEQKMVLQNVGDINASVLKTGKYYISFRKTERGKTPGATSFSITDGKTTVINANFNDGTVTVDTK